MATLEINFLQTQLEDRKRRLEDAIALAPANTSLSGLLREVDSALERMDKGSYGLCQECHDTVEQDRLLADPLVRYCLDHLTQGERAALQRDLDLASLVQRKMLPEAGLRAGGWETSYHYAPVGPVSTKTGSTAPAGPSSGTSGSCTVTSTEPSDSYRTPGSKPRGGVMRGLRESGVCSSASRSERDIRR